MNDQNKNEEIDIFSEIEEYIILLNEEFTDRIENYKIDLFNNKPYEVCGALLARQVSLATEIAKSPSIWNGHVCPIILRAMVDTYITLSWILDDKETRSKLYMEFGIGQQKLFIEHLKNNKRVSKEYILVLEDWMKSQKFEFLTEVNIGSWSGKSIRQMAEESGCIDFYNFCYIPFSAAAHSMWNHVSKYNLRQCENPLHKFHDIPINPDLPLDTHYFYLAGKYVNKTFSIFDKKTGYTFNGKNSYEYLTNFLTKSIKNSKE
ncbi:MAG TPA: DUF5677 domain-containing protein [Ignavibacteria bacterium]|nr:DUF5677 domain-containing protein [Ignavibacteria bacterium]HMR41550.1 DUF5677 domain-containing protein [Ignavibacteria bacterium]